MSKKVLINGLYFALSGDVRYSKIRGILFNPKNHICVEKTDNNEYINIFTGKKVQLFQNSKVIGKTCIDEETLEPLSHVFDHPSVKIITTKLIKETLNELDMPNIISNFGKCYVSVCKLNKLTNRDIFEHIKKSHKDFESEDDAIVTTNKKNTSKSKTNKEDVKKEENELKM